MNMENIYIKKTLTDITRTVLLSALCFLWAGTAAQASGDVELDLTKGDIEISSDGYRQGDGKKKEGPTSGDGYIITTNGKETDHVVTVASGKKHDIMFDKVRISTVSGGYNPLYIAPNAGYSPP